MKKALFLAFALALNLCLSAAGAAQARINNTDRTAASTVYGTEDSLPETEDTDESQPKENAPRHMPRVKKGLKNGNPV